VSPYGFSGSISAEGRCRRASTTGCYLPASPPRVLLVEQQAPLEFPLESNSLCNLTSHFAAWYRFDVLRIDQHERELFLQYIPNRLPLHPRRLHGHHLTVIAFEPVAQTVQFAKPRAKCAHLFVHPLRASEQQTRHDQLFVNS
jgi:hypothetical protein